MVFLCDFLFIPFIYLYEIFQVHICSSVKKLEIRSAKQ